MFSRYLIFFSVAPSRSVQQTDSTRVSRIENHIILLYSSLIGDWELPGHKCSGNVETAVGTDVIGIRLP